MEEEKQPLQRLVADLSLNKQLLQDVLKQPSEARAASHAAQHLLDAYRISTRRACRVIGLPRASFAYHAHRRDDTLRQRLRELAQGQVRYSSPRLCILLRREGWPDNRKRVHRLYCLEGLTLRSKRPRRNRATAHRLARLPLGRLPQRWRLAFGADTLLDGRKIRALTIVDNFSRQCGPSR